jgi:acetyltransferase-like isoleucine patch superfamily enzyme
MPDLHVETVPWSERVRDRLAGMRTRLHTWRVRGRFARWGHRSRVEAPCKLVRPWLVRVGDQVHLGAHAWLNASDDRRDGQPTLHIGDGTYIGRFTQINAWRDVAIGRNVLIADRVFISDADHCFRDTSTPIIHQGDTFVAPVRLLDGCWIGIGAVILPGVTVGRNAVVAANAVVTRDVPDFTVVGGIPATVLKNILTGS